MLPLTCNITHAYMSAPLATLRTPVVQVQEATQGDDLTPSRNSHDTASYSQGHRQAQLGFLLARGRQVVLEKQSSRLERRPDQHQPPQAGNLATQTSPHAMQDQHDHPHVQLTRQGCSPRPTLITNAQTRLVSTKAGPPPINLHNQTPTSIASISNPSPPLPFRPPPPHSQWAAWSANMTPPRRPSGAALPPHHSPRSHPPGHGPRRSSASPCPTRRFGRTPHD